ncbi:RNA-binding protein [Halobacteriales archaeon QS_8_69_26]|nr:MAG: RNA-binding protein [Halobacteriales archaeon QS_8_69_26]
MTSVRVRGIYATALTGLARSAGHSVVWASDPIRRRFDADFGEEPPAVDVSTTEDRLGVGIDGDPEGVVEVTETVAGVGRDALAWTDPAPRGAVFDAEVTDTVGGGALLDLGEREGYLPFDAAEGYVDTGDRFRVQVDDPEPPWSDARPELRTGVRTGGHLVSLDRGQSGPSADAGGERATELARTADLLDPDVPDGWGTHFRRPATDAGMDALGTALERAVAVADALDAALAEAPEDPAAGDLPRELATPLAGRWVRFGRESRFALDGRRRAVVPTMAGHHRIKAGHRAASTAVDFVEGVCGSAGVEEDDDSAGDAADGSFPFEATVRQFGPAEGDRVRIAHGKPDGRAFDLGRAEVTDLDPGGEVTLRRTMSGSGTYDGLGTRREPGDVAVTRVTEGRWWYPTVYRGEDGESKGTYVNVCTPVEVFPDAVSYVDLHVDVVRQPDGSVERVDDDELDAAEEAGDVPPDLAEKAREVASRLEEGL